ncbi:putative bifunctional diguanylate cyclase/phosphodiesterase [Symbioplanes lichenis]|uniref:putative bifunctional diguanylate cyclase/phosphodiesterase n=1 Tax=Symbioplanes lichenis TaxID=1629072 RepID=UPI0027383657|nr:EAL domain-containing protein [Actinoplanes lichenis]
MDREPRAAGWDRRLLVISGSLAAAAVAWLVLAFLTGPVGPELTGWLIAPVSAAVAAVLCWRAGSASEAVALRRFWRRFGVSLGILAAAAALRTATSLHAGLHMVTEVSTSGGLLQTAGTVLMVWSLLALPWGLTSRAQRIATGLDIGIVVAAVGIFYWHFSARSMFDGSQHVAPVAGIALVAAGLLGALAIAKTAITAAATLDDRSMRALRLAFLTGIAGAVLTPLFDRHEYLDANLLILPVGSFFVALAARSQGPAAPARRYSTLPYLAAGATSALLIVLIVRDSRDLLPVAVAAVALTALVIVRQLTSMRENNQLLARLDTNMLELRLKEQRFRLLVQNSSDVVTITELGSGVISYISPAVENVLGYAPGTVVGTDLRERVHPEDREPLTKAVAALAAAPTGTIATYRTRFAHADGSWRTLEVTSANLAGEPSVGGIISNGRDVTETVEAHERLSYEATHDVLTGLANRALFGERVEACVRRARAGQAVSIVLVDLDDFKTVNDTLGHATGDGLLVAVAERMLSTVRPSDTVARLGGDEFAILFEGLDGGSVDRVLERIADALAVPVDIDGHLLSVRASFGVVEGRGGDDPGNLLRQADIAMYEAKERGDGGYQRYRPGSEARGAERHRITAALTTALEREEFVLHYQPVVTLPGGELTGVEALVRWVHPKRGLLGPGEFIPGAELTGMIVPLGRWVLREACRQAAAWERELGDRAPGTMSVNVSARQLQNAGFAEEVAAVLAETGLAASRLTIEITESIALGGGATHETLSELRALGVRLSLDDFGTGASTLSLLKNCPVDQIKLDRSFAPGAGPDAIAGAVLQLARTMGVEAVAEGVETPEQAARLGDLGYLRAQGFHFARPMAPELISGFTLAEDRLSVPR